MNFKTDKLNLFIKNIYIFRSSDNIEIIPRVETECHECPNEFQILNQQSIEDNTNGTEVGQILMDFLLKRGEIEPKSNFVPKIRREEKNVRYDELIGAFNVILEEILRQGQFKSHAEHQETEIDLSNCNQIDDDYNDHKRQTSKHTFSKPVKSTDSQNRCLNSIETQLLENVKSLNHQLTKFMQISLKNKRSVDKSDDFEAIDERISPIGKRQAEEDTPVELNKENNFGLDVEKFVKYEGENFEYKDESQTESQTESTENNLNEITTESTQTPNPVTQTPNPVTQPPNTGTSANSNAGSIDIPLRLVKGSDGRIKLILDRRNICQNRRCKQRKLN